MFFLIFLAWFSFGVFGGGGFLCVFWVGSEFVGFGFVFFSLTVHSGFTAICPKPDLLLKIFGVKSFKFGWISKEHPH